MAPILGILASSQQGAISNTSFESIATVTVGSGGSSSITFSSIPSTYQHLQIRSFAKIGANANDFSNIVYQFNSDTGANYTLHTLRGNGSNAQVYSATGTPAVYSNPAAPASPSAYANMFGTAILDILDYSNTNKYKTTRSLQGFETNGGYGYAGITSGVWLNTAAITSITITPDYNSWTQYSSFALYGIKG